MTYYNDLNACRQAGRDYARACIECGAVSPLDAPLSGEWADGLTGQDVLNMAGINATWRDLDDFEQADILNAWEDGYFSADWPDWEE